MTANHSHAQLLLEVTITQTIDDVPRFLHALSPHILVAIVYSNVRVDDCSAEPFGMREAPRQRATTFVDDTEEIVDAFRKATKEHVKLHAILSVLLFDCPACFESDRQRIFDYVAFQLNRRLRRLMP